MPACSPPCPTPPRPHTCPCTCVCVQGGYPGAGGGAKGAQAAAVVDVRRWAETRRGVGCRVTLSASAGCSGGRQGQHPVAPGLAVLCAVISQPPAPSQQHACTTNTPRPTRHTHSAGAPTGISAPTATPPQRLPRPNGTPAPPADVYAEMPWHLEAQQRQVGVAPQHQGKQSGYCLPALFSHQHLPNT